MKTQVARNLKLGLIFSEQKGVTLLETLAALALLAIIGVAFLSAIATSSITMANAEEKVEIDNLARAQMEYTKSGNYTDYIYGSPPSPDIPPDYATLDELAPADPYAIPIPTGYSINVTAVALHEPDTGIQKITVTVSREGKDLLVMEGYKVNR